jgi:DNA ligase (NAD+)
MSLTGRRGASYYWRAMAKKNGTRIVELESLVRKHQNLYYNGQPEISDAEFDALWDELRELDPGNRLFETVGADAADGWPKTRHLIPMGSQEKASNPEDFLAWCAKVGHPEYIVQYKLDGASLELQYEEGRLVKAVTRGDGEVGDDITPNASKMRGVIARLKEDFTGGVRGEVLMSHEVHDSKHAEKANCRNAANGLMKRKDGVGVEDLDLVCYDATGTVPAASDLFGPAGVLPFADEVDKVVWLRRMGFETSPQEIFSKPEEVVDYRARVMDRRPSLPFDIDGLVVKGRAIDPEDLARPRPEKQIAFKFSLEEAISTLREIEWSESGASFTPIGIVDPVRLAGTTVQRANLVNTNIIKGMDLRIGSRVIMTKRGEIIPKIEGLVENPEGTREIEVPSRCSCGEALVDEGTRLYCPNPDCPKKLRHRIEKWLSVLDVRDFGSVIVGKLLDSGRLRSIPDLYGLEPEELAEYDRMGDTLARKILHNLEAKSEVSLARFVAGFDIEGIGELITEKAIAAGFDSLEKLRGAKIEELAVVDGLGEITARSIIQGLAVLKSEMDELLASGAVRILPPNVSGPFAGKSFCFTGELSSMKRPEAEALVRSLGGTAKSSVTKGLSYLVTNDPSSGSEKNKKATSYGVGIVDEEEFLRMAGRK